MIHEKLLASGIGLLSGGIYGFMQMLASNSTDPIPRIAVESLAASIFAAAVSYPLLQERVKKLREDLTNHTKENTEQFTEIRETLAETTRILRELTGDVGELVGEARARRRGAIHTRGTDTRR